MAIRGRFSAWLFVFIALRVSAQQYSPDLLGGLQWRDVGPMRAGAVMPWLETRPNPIRFIPARWEAAYGRPKTRAHMVFHWR